jgi:hypothetical protein
MSIARLLLSLIAYAALSGCVLGYGPCLVLQPVSHEFVGVVHFHDYPEPDGIDNVPILVTDTTAYVYAPAQSHRCLPANDLQMVGVAEFPRNIGENSHVAVTGSLTEATTSRQHTTFLLNVTTIVLSDAPERTPQP